MRLRRRLSCSILLFLFVLGERIWSMTGDHADLVLSLVAWILHILSESIFLYRKRQYLVDAILIYLMVFLNFVNVFLWIFRKYADDYLLVNFFIAFSTYRFQSFIELVLGADRRSLQVRCMDFAEDVSR
jgi:hypothetical protein